MDVSHELGALRFVVDSPLSSKVAMFNQQVNQHKQSQLLNPFAQSDGRASPKPTFSKDEYGKPLAGSLTEMRGQKANIHVLKEMLELCQIIDSEGYTVKDEPTMRVIPFGELFNIYNYISDKVVGILLRARKHKLVEFEGEMLFQRRDDDVPVFLLKPILEIRRDLEEKVEIVKRSGSASPQATSVILDKRAYGLNVPRGATPISRTPSPQTSKSSSPARENNAKSVAVTEAVTDVPKTELLENKSADALQTTTVNAGPQQTEETKSTLALENKLAEPLTTAAAAGAHLTLEVEEVTKSTEVLDNKSTIAPTPTAAETKTGPAVVLENKLTEAPVPVAISPEAVTQQVCEVTEEIKPEAPTTTTTKTTQQANKTEEGTKSTEVTALEQQPAPPNVPVNINDTPVEVAQIKTDVNNNSNNNNLPTIIVEATAVYVRPAKSSQTLQTSTTTIIIPNSETDSAVPSNAPTENAASN